MRLWCVLLAALLLGLLVAPAQALHEFELWRSNNGVVRWVSADPSDDSVWACIGSRVYHFDVDMNLVGRFDGWRPAMVGPDEAAGCWIVDRGYPYPGGDYPQWMLSHQVAGWPVPFIVTGLSEPLDLLNVTGTAWVLDRWGALSAAQLEVTGGASFGREASGFARGMDGSLWAAFPDGMLVAKYMLAGSPPAYELVFERGLLDDAASRQRATVAVSSTNASAWIAEWGNGRLVQYDTLGDEKARIGGYAHPGPLEIGPDGSIWLVEDTGLSHLSSAGRRLWSEGAALPPGTTLPTPSLSVDSVDGSVWVAHTGGALPRLGHYSLTDYSLLWQLGDTLGPSASVAVDPSNSSVWIADTESNRLVKLGGDGGLITMTPVASRLTRPDFVLLDTRDGSVLANDRGVWDPAAQRYSDAQLVRFAADGMETWRGPAGADLRQAALNPTDGSFWIARSGYDDGVWHGPVVIHYSSAGTEVGRYTGLFVSPLSLAVAPDGTCWLGATADAAGAGVLVHLAGNGAELGRVTTAEFGADGYRPTHLAINPFNGALWVALWTESEGWEYGAVAMLNSAGEFLWSQGYDCGGVAVDPITGFGLLTCGDYLVILSNNGTELWRTDGFNFSSASQPARVPADGSCWVPDTQNGQVVHVEAIPLTPFDDITYDFWARREITACATADIVQGYPVGTYEPDQVVTRDQMAVYIARALAGGDANVPDGPSQPTFPDVATDTWAYKYVEYAAAHAVVGGYPDGKYQPGLDVDRGQMAVFLARALAGGDALVPDGPGTPVFWDLTTDFWAYKHIAYLKSLGVVGGYPDGRYLPAWLVTRDQMAVFVTRAFGLPLGP